MYRINKLERNFLLKFVIYLAFLCRYLINDEFCLLFLWFFNLELGHWIPILEINHQVAKYMIIRFCLWKEMFGLRELSVTLLDVSIDGVGQSINNGKPVVQKWDRDTDITSMTVTKTADIIWINLYQSYFLRNPN
jgi:hypothetical protein